MGYMSKKGKRPPEYASKASHGYVIQDEEVNQLLQQCNLPKKSSDIDFDDKFICHLEKIDNNPIKHVIAIDGGYNEVVVQKEFPSATIAFFQFGALRFTIEDLENLAVKPFIDPDDIQKLKNIDRQKLAIPTKNISFKNEKDLIDSVRKILFDFFSTKPDKELFIDTLKWFLFQEYDTGIPVWHLASCPGALDGKVHGVEIYKNDLEDDHTYICPECGTKIYLTDVFRLHEAIDNELGAGGILGYLMTTIEQMLLVHLFRLILNIKESLFNEIIFIKDGPLGFFGQTANIHKPMRKLCNFLIENYNLHLAGLEKSGAFCEHADEINKKMKSGDVLLLNNDYIYKYIIPGKADDKNPYARTSYYGSKLFYKSSDERMYVVTIPVKDEKIVLNPKKSDFANLDIILSNINKLKCDMYDNSLIPVALANKLVSLANHPSTVILEKFAKITVGQ